MQDARDQNAPGLLPVEYDVLALLHTTQARPNMITRPTQLWIVGKRLATSLKVADVTDNLCFAPSVECINANAQQVSFGPTRETKRCHRLAWARGKFEFSSNTSKYIAAGNPAGIAFVNGCSQCGKLSFVLLFLALQTS